MDSFAALATLEIAHDSPRRIGTRPASVCCGGQWTTIVGSDRPVQFINAFVDGLDLTAAGFAGPRRKRWGVPATRRATFEKLYIYGYLNRVRSRPAAGGRSVIATSRSSGCCGRATRTSRPSPISGATIRGVSRRVPRVRIAVPTPRPVRPRVAGGRRNPHQGGQQQRPQLHPLFAARVHPPRRRSGWKTTSSGSTRAMSRTARQAAARTHEEPGRKDCGAQRKAQPLPSDAAAQLEGEPARTRSSLTDPDSRAMAAHTKVGVGYNVQVAVDAKNSLIVEQAVTNLVDVDMGLLTETPSGGRLREILEVETIDVVADRSYFKIEDIEACDERAAFPALPSRSAASSVREGLFRKDEFRYDAGLDAYVCPAGKLLTPIRRGRMRDLEKDRLRQPESLPRLPAAPAMHERRPLRFPPRKRRRSRSHGRAPQSEAGDSRPPPRGRRAPVRQHQAVDVSGRLPDARPRQRARRVQPDRARL